VARTALVTGGNRGIGLEACRQLAESGMRVVLAARDPEKGKDAARKLQERGLEVTSEQLDVADSRSVEDCVRRLGDTDTEIDVLVNNAGAYPTEGVFSVSEETLVMALGVNTVGPFRICRALVPGMVQRGYGRVVNVSSGGGSFGEGLGPAAYAVSKAALNALTVKVSQAVHGDVKVNAMCPGWVRTDMGGFAAPVRPRRPRTPWCSWPRCPPTAQTAVSSGIESPSPGSPSRT
jgi:NAD(P)-dependent dehydrogenase (short-subunit alcohol dehydrogenase family)